MVLIGGANFIVGNRPKPFWTGHCRRNPHGTSGKDNNRKFGTSGGSGIWELYVDWDADISAICMTLTRMTVLLH